VIQSILYTSYLCLSVVSLHEVLGNFKVFLENVLGDSAVYVRPRKYPRRVVRTVNVVVHGGYLPLKVLECASKGRQTPTLVAILANFEQNAADTSVTSRKQCLHDTPLVGLRAELYATKFSQLLFEIFQTPLSRGIHPAPLEGRPGLGHESRASQS